jgi:hypothetical protein
MRGLLLCLTGVKMGKVKKTIPERFWSRVDRRGADECWPWTGANSRGYGQFYVDGRNRRATQVSWEMHNGAPFPDGKMACHSCDNPACVNPRHIWPGTMSDNINDCVRKGRHVSPNVPWNAGLTHCKRGHEFTAENTYWRKGIRSCRKCIRLSKIRELERLKLARKARRARAALGGDDE